MFLQFLLQFCGQWYYLLHKGWLRLAAAPVVAVVVSLDVAAPAARASGHGALVVALEAPGASGTVGVAVAIPSAHATPPGAAAAADPLVGEPRAAGTLAALSHIRVPTRLAIEALVSSGACEVAPKPSGALVRCCEMRDYYY